MALDPPTLLMLSIALAGAAALYLAIEWRIIGESSLLLWSAGFATISVGSTLALLRVNGFLLIGIWFANGLLIVAHWLFLLGVARFTQQRLSRGWYLIFLLWLGLRWPFLTWALSGVLWFCAGLWYWNLPNFPFGGGWFFNPIAWQFVFSS